MLLRERGVNLKIHPLFLFGWTLKQLHIAAQFKGADLCVVRRMGDVLLLSYQESILKSAFCTVLQHRSSL